MLVGGALLGRALALGSDQSRPVVLQALEFGGLDLPRACHQGVRSQQSKEQDQILELRSRIYHNTNIKKSKVQYIPYPFQE